MTYQPNNQRLPGIIYIDSPWEVFLACCDIVLNGSNIGFPILENGVQLTYAQCALIVNQKRRTRTNPPRRGRKRKRPLSGFFVRDPDLE